MITNIIFRRSDSPMTSDKPHYPYELPKGWGWTTLPELCVLPITDGTHQTPTYTDKANGIPFLSSKDVTSQKIDWTNIKYITKDLHEILYKRIAPQKNDILLAKNGTTGVAAIVEDERVFDIYVTLAVIRPSNFIDPKFLLYIINSVFCKKQFNDHLTGIGLPNLHLTDIKKTIIPVPPYKEQVKIVDTINRLFKWIDVVDKGRLNTNELISQTKAKILDLAIHGKLVPQDPTDEPASKLLKRINPKAEITCDNGHYQKLPEGWCMTNIGSLFDAVSAKRVLKSEWKDKGVPFYRAREIVQLNKEGFADKDLFISEEHFSEIKDKYGIPAYGDIMISAVGSIGYTYIVKENDVFYYKDASVLCLKNTRHWNSKFFSIWLASPFLQEQMYKNSKGTTVDTITLEKLKGYVIPFPPLNEQHRIVAKVEEIFAQLDTIEASL